MNEVESRIHRLSHVAGQQTCNASQARGTAASSSERTTIAMADKQKAGKFNFVFVFCY